MAVVGDGTLLHAIEFVKLERLVGSTSVHVKAIFVAGRGNEARIAQFKLLDVQAQVL